MRRLVLLAAAVLCISAVSAPAALAQDGSNTVVDVAVGASGGGTPDGNPADYDILVQALTAAELVKPLEGDGPFTVFAPNDRAFQRLVFDITGQRLDEPDTLAAVAGLLDGPGDLANVLTYHVVAGERLGPLRVLLSRRLEMLNGGVVRPLFAVLRDENTAFRDPLLVLRAINIGASNGVIHTINRVLVPDPLVQSAA
jgi:uncharacterized surface protein with fasciclin (FAS1) repeats